jgi:hypothetical protein
VLSQPALPYDRHLSKTSDAREFYQIQKFVAACRRQWPGAKIVLRPNQDGASTGADAPIPLTLHPELNTMTDNLKNDLDTPTEADLDSCYGGKYLSATEVGERKIRTKTARVRKVALQQQGGGTKPKFVLSFTTLDKELVLNTTNKNALVNALGRKPADWIGADVGIYTEPTTFSGKPTRGLRLRVLNKPVTAPNPAPKPAATEEDPWPDEAGDPGADFKVAAE